MKYKKKLAKLAARKAAQEDYIRRAKVPEGSYKIPGSQKK